MSVDLLSTRLLAAAEPAAAPAPASATPDYGSLYPAGVVKLENQPLKFSTQVVGGLAAVGGLALLGVALLTRGNPGGISRLNLAPLVLGGLLAGGGAATALGAELIPPKSKLALATNIPTQDVARTVAATFTKNTEIVQDESGRFAVLERPGTYRAPSGGGHRQPTPYRPAPYYPPSQPYYPPSRPDPYYPSNPGGGYTSPGDDYNSSPSYPTPSGGRTSPGDDGGSSYDPPSYDPPSYDPPSYDPPSYDPPSYDPPSYGGNSSSNGNPSEDDF